MGLGTMPATARLRVRGAMTSRLGSVIGPSLKGSKSLDDVLILCCFPVNYRSGGWDRGVHCESPRQAASYPEIAFEPSAVAPRLAAGWEAYARSMICSQSETKQHR